MRWPRGGAPRHLVPASLAASVALLVATSALASGGETGDAGEAAGGATGVELRDVASDAATDAREERSTTTAPPSSAANELPRAPVAEAPAPSTAGSSGDAGVSPPRRADAPPEARGSDAAETPPPAADTAPTRCVVTLHGKGGSGAPPRDEGGVTVLSPAGNAPGWGGRQWRYDDPATLAQARATVRGAVDDAGCDRVVVHGFSNGAAFAASLFCHGEDLDGRLARVIVDDPVTDAGVLPCAPAGGVALTLYWTGALAATAPAGWACAPADWTCAGGTSIGIGAYAAALGVTAKASPMGGHAMYTAAPERLAF